MNWEQMILSGSDIFRLPYGPIFPIKKPRVGGPVSSGQFGWTWINQCPSTPPVIMDEESILIAKTCHTWPSTKVDLKLMSMQELLLASHSRLLLFFLVLKPSCAHVKLKLTDSRYNGDIKCNHRHLWSAHTSEAWGISTVSLLLDPCGCRRPLRLPARIISAAFNLVSSEVNNH